MLVLFPPFESAREQLFNSFFDCQSGTSIASISVHPLSIPVLVITSQKRLKTSRYQVNAEVETHDDDLVYNDLFIKFPQESSASIGSAYEAIEHLLAEAETYFQVSWTASEDDDDASVFSRAGSNTKFFGISNRTMSFKG